MTLNKKNWFARYYNWVTGKYPKDVCSFFWGTLIIILLSPFILPAKLIPDPDRDLDNYGLQALIGLIMYCIYFFIMGVGNLVFKFIGYEFIYMWAYILGGFLIGSLFIAVIIFTSISIVHLFKKTIKNVPETHIIDNTVDFIGAIKGKYCTKITWKD